MYLCINSYFILEGICKIKKKNEQVVLLDSYTESPARIIHRQCLEEINHQFMCGRLVSFITIISQLSHSKNSYKHSAGGHEMFSPKQHSFWKYTTQPVTFPSNLCILIEPCDCARDVCHLLAKVDKRRLCLLFILSLSAQNTEDSKTPGIQQSLNMERTQIQKKLRNTHI